MNDFSDNEARSISAVDVHFSEIKVRLTGLGCVTIVILRRPISNSGAPPCFPDVIDSDGVVRFYFTCITCFCHAPDESTRWRRAALNVT